MDFYRIFKVVQPFLQDKVNLHDSCGVNNLHGIPGILGGLLRLKIKFPTILRGRKNVKMFNILIPRRLQKQMRKEEC